MESTFNRERTALISDLDFLSVSIQQRIALATSEELEMLHHMAVYKWGVSSWREDRIVWRHISTLEEPENKRLITVLTCLKRMTLLCEKEMELAEREARHDEKMKQAEAEWEDRLKAVCRREMEVARRERAL
jgi:hypothetical protein